MPVELKDAKKTLQVVEVKRYGEAITIPEKMKLEDAIEVIKRRMAYEEQIIGVSRSYNCFPWDGGLALKAALEKKFGWAQQEDIHTFWGKVPPQMITVDSGPNGKQEQIPWGKFTLPGLEDAYFQLSYEGKGLKFGFLVSGQVKRKHEHVVNEILSDVATWLASNSIYRGQAIKLRVKNESGADEALPTPIFLDTDAIDLSEMVFPRDVQAAIETNLFTPIERIKDCRLNKIPIKRGVLLAGVFGVGKTLAARAAAKLAVRNKVTYVYCERASEFATVVAFARQYLPAVVFCEDIDRVTAGERSMSTDEILNIVDGIDSKNAEMIVVLTTNAVEKMQQAMLRPGRLDAVIEVALPDAETVEKLVRIYGKETIAEDANLTDVGQLLCGNIPAVITEVVHRAKLAQLRRTPVGQKLGKISAEALTESATTMHRQLELLNRHEDVPEPSLDVALRNLVRKELSPVTRETVRDLAESLGRDRDIIADHELA